MHRRDVESCQLLLLLLPFLLLLKMTPTALHGVQHATCLPPHAPTWVLLLMLLLLHLMMPMLLISAQFLLHPLQRHLGRWTVQEILPPVLPQKRNPATLLPPPLLPPQQQVLLLDRLQQG